MVENKRGSALISALFIMTLVAIAATAMSTRLQLDIYRTRLTIASNKLYLASQAVTFWAMSELNNKKNNFLVANQQGKVAEFPKRLKIIYPQFTISGKLYDLQSRFNLNNLANPHFFSAFLRLLAEQKINLNTREVIALSTRHWLSPYQPGGDSDHFMNFYLQQNPPYFASNQPFQSFSEFRLVHGVNSKIAEIMSNSLTVLPEITPLNINTASPQILSTLRRGLKISEIEQILQARGKKGISTLKKITPLLKKLAIRSEQITLSSQYFLSIATVRSEDFSLTNFAIFKRNKNKQGKISVKLIHESLHAL